MADAPKSAGPGEAGASAPAPKVVKQVHILKAGPKAGRLALRPVAGAKGGGVGHVLERGDGTASEAKPPKKRAKHVHGPDCNHGPDLHAHGPDCDHGPDAHGPRRERPHGTRTAETGGQACQLDLEFLLPGESDEAGRFAKLEHALESHRGITDAHLRRDGAHLEVCVHYDAAVVSLTQVLALVRGAGSGVAERYRTRTWLVRGMNSSQCAAIIEHALRRAPGVLSANVSYAAERVVIEYDTRVLKERALERRLEVLGYNLEEPSHGHVCAFHGAKSGLAPRLEMPLVVSAGLLILAAFVLERTGVVATTGFTVASALYLLALGAAGAFPARGAFQALRQRRLDVESLVVLAALAAPVLGMWGEGAFLLFLFGLGHAFEHRALERARRAIEALGKLRPEVARVRRGEAWVEAAVRDVLRGERVAVRPGDRVPLDGVIREGRSAFDQAAVTGESVPVDKGPGDEVWAGTINVSASFELEVTRRASESVLARVVDLVADAEAQKSPTQRFAQRVERRFVPIVLLAVLALPFVLLALGTPLSEGIARALAVLVAATPCALAIATPAAVLAAVGRAARAGVLIKGGAHLEALGHARTVAFDKTGTLTIGRPRVVALLPEAGVSEDELLAVAAGLEVHSTHPLARAIMDAAGERALTSLPVAQVEAIHGKGLKAVHGGEALSVGNRALFDGVFPEAMQGALQAQEALGRTTMIVRRGERWLGVIAVADTLRPEAKGALAALKTLGITKTVMLSGDQRAVARAIADEVGITDPRAPLMPEGKVAVLQELACEGGVVMVGDGVNDAPALAAASVGIAMGGAGSDAAIETADVVLMGDDLHKLPFAIALARRATRTIRQNVIVALGVAVVLVVASIAGWTGIGEAVILHEGSTVVVVLNGLWLLRFKQRPEIGGVGAASGRSGA